jgi:4,4'-diaponeurosporenoate glycosyltransferase
MDFILPAVCMGGLVTGFLLLWRIPTIPKSQTLEEASADVSVIIPARNEEANLPALLTSLMSSQPRPAEVIVVDDGSTDNTASIATAFGATVITSTSPEPGWRGKNWALHHGTLAATRGTLLFLDADTRFAEGGFGRTISFFRSLPPETALSLLPFHTTLEPYEELSLFFNLLMAIGAGGFGGLDRPRLFGQSLLIHRETYLRAGGHAAVRHHILENLHLALHIRAVNGQPQTVSGRGTLFIRMFPHGITQLRESWEKAFVSGAGVTSTSVLLLSIYWLSAAATVLLLVLVDVGSARLIALSLYVAFAAQIAWLSRQIGTFRIATALLYPIPLLFYFIIFGRSAWLQYTQRPVAWKGRQL